MKIWKCSKCFTEFEVSDNFHGTIICQECEPFVDKEKDNILTVAYLSGFEVGKNYSESVLAEVRAVIKELKVNVREWSDVIEESDRNWNSALEEVEKILGEHSS